jgi:hypothetical protein
MPDSNLEILRTILQQAEGAAVSLEGERCLSLRCKGMYTNMGQPVGTTVTGDGHFWCAKTQRIYGPDDQLVADGNCRHSGRGCYEGA